MRFASTIPSIIVLVVTPVHAGNKNIKLDNFLKNRIKTISSEVLKKGSGKFFEMEPKIDQNGSIGLIKYSLSYENSGNTTNLFNEIYFVNKNNAIVSISDKLPEIDSVLSSKLRYDPNIELLEGDKLKISYWFWTEEDPRCCPSLSYAVIYSFDEKFNLIGAKFLNKEKEITNSEFCTLLNIPQRKFETPSVRVKISPEYVSFVESAVEYILSLSLLPESQKASTEAIRANILKLKEFDLNYKNSEHPKNKTFFSDLQNICDYRLGKGVLLEKFYDNRDGWYQLKSSNQAKIDKMHINCKKIISELKNNATFETIYKRRI